MKPAERFDSAALRSALTACLDPALARAIDHRCRSAGPYLLAALESLYGQRSDLGDCLHDWAQRVGALIAARPAELIAFDHSRPPDWFDRPDLIGYSTYVDRFAGNLAGVAERIPYLNALGVRYLHLLPFLRARAGDNDGGFAISDYGQVEPRLGSNADLIELTRRLRAAGISLCADLVLNHCADDHPWARAARAGSERHQAMFRIIRDPDERAAWAAPLGEVFPDTAPGNFTWVAALDGWVWTTFYPYQWDLDWSNPEVFVELSLALLRLANLGVEVFRLDSAAYLWKRRGSPCVNLPENHTLLRALRAVVEIAAPSVLLKAEVIMPMRDLPPYFGIDRARDPDPDTGAPVEFQRECHLAYHSSLMAAAWAGLASQRADLIAQVLAESPVLPPTCAWLTYVRCHDDIGWTVLADEAVGAHAPDLATIAAFYAGRSPGSYARGEDFQTGYGRAVHGSNGMTAALVGLDLDDPDPIARAAALRRYLLLYGLILAAPGVPLIYMGDELGLDNDTGYRTDPTRRSEGRWLHRPMMDWPRAEAARQGSDNPVWRGLARLITARRLCPALAPSRPSHAELAAAPSVLAIARGSDTPGQRFLGLFNFADRSTTLRLPAAPQGSAWHDLLAEPNPTAPTDPTGVAISLEHTLEPHGLRWLIAR